MATFYVEKTGSDSSGNGSQGSPWLTIGKAIQSAQSGDKIVVGDGTYTAVNVNKGGLTLSAKNRRAAKIDAGAFWGIQVTANNVTVDGFEVYNAAFGIGGVSVHHIAVRNCTARDNGRNGISFSQSEFLTVERNIAYGNANDGFYSGISVLRCQPVANQPSTPGYRIVIRENVTYDNITLTGAHSDGNGIIIDDYDGDHTLKGPPPYTYPTLVEGNITYSNGGRGIQVYFASNVTVKDNIAFHNNRDNLATGTWRGELSNQASDRNTWSGNTGVADRGINQYNTAIANVSYARADRGGQNTNITWTGNTTWNGTAGSSSLNITSGNAAPSASTNSLGVDPGLTLAIVQQLGDDLINGSQTPDPQLPVNVTAPQIAEISSATLALTTAGTWTGADSLSYSWRVNGVATGQTDPNGFSTSGLVNGDSVTILETAVNADGTASMASNAIGVVVTAPGVLDGIVMRDGAPIRRQNGTIRRSFDPTAPNWFNWGGPKVWLESDDAISGPFRIVVDVDSGIVPSAKAKLVFSSDATSRGIVFAPVVGDQTVASVFGIADDAGTTAVLYPIDSDGKVGAMRGTIPIATRDSAPFIISVVVAGTGVAGSSQHTATVETIGSAPITLAYQWQFDGVNVAGATAASFTPAAADAGKSLAVGVTATNAHGAYGPVVSDVVALTAADFAAPGLVEFTAATGSGSGEIDITVTAPLPAAGDGAVLGDGAAALDRLEFIIAAGIPATLVTPAATGSYTVTTDSGVIVQVGVRAVSDFGREGEWAYATATSGGIASPSALEYLGGLVSLTLTAGDAWSVDWDTYWTGATSYLVDTGPTGGVSSNGDKTRDLYSVAALTAETLIVSVTASDAAGNQDSRSFTVTIESAAIAPSLTSPIEERFVVPRGSSVTYDMTRHFAGTDLVYSSPDDDGNFAITAAGSFRSLVPLNSAIATHTRTITATNGLGSVSDTISVGVTASPMQALTAAEIAVARSVYAFGGSTWRRPQARLPGAVPLVANPFAFTVGESSVTVKLTAHNRAIGDRVAFSGAVVAAGLTIAGTYTVSAIPDVNSFRITAVGPASATADGGGSSVLFRIPPVASLLGSAPFAFTVGESSVTVTWNGHPAGVGRVVDFDGATVAAGLTIDGAYLVTEVVSANVFRIDAGANASATTSGGGSAVTATLRPHNAALFPATDPLATTASSATVTVTMPGHALAAGRPVTLAGFAAIGGLALGDINGDRTVLAVTSKDTFTFTAGAPASSAAPGGGTAGVIRPRWAAMKWSRRDPDANGVIPDSQSEETPNAWQEVGEGLWETHMEAAASEGNPDSQSPRSDYSVWFTEANDTIRLAVQETALWSEWSAAARVPLVPVVDPGGDTTAGWLPNSSRTKDAYEKNDPDSRGLQFERVVTWYRGTSPDKAGWVFGGQDENGVWISKDYGRTWRGNAIPGLYCSLMAGIYIDDDVGIMVGAMSGATSWNAAKPCSGAYLVDPDLRWASRMNLSRTGEGPDAGGGLKQAFVRMQQGASNRRSQNCVGRRQRVAGLTHADCPIWIVENQLSNTGQDVLAIYIWKVVLSGRAQVGSATMVRTLPIGSYAGGDIGVYHVYVAPNGDVMLTCKQGVFLSTDGFATAPSQIFGFEAISGGFYGGGVSSVSGARIGSYVATSNGGVWQTPNVRTTGFSKPNGNAGLPANYRVWHMGMVGDVLAVCTKGNPPYRSTDGGRNFSRLPEPTRTPEEAVRYLIRGNGHTSFHPCPADQNVWLIPNYQTMVRSTDRLDTIDERGCAYFSGHHIKGMGFGTSDWKQVAQTSQDAWVDTSLDGINWTQDNGIGNTGQDNFLNMIAARGGGNKGYLLGNASLMTASNRVIGSCNRSAGGFPNVIVVLDNRNASTGKYGSYTALTNGTTSKCLAAKWSPKGGGIGFLGRWTVSNVNGAAIDINLRDHSGHEFIDCALSGSTLVSFWGNYGASTGSSIYRSTNDLGDHGAAWYNVGYPSQAICMDHHHPTLERMLYTPTGNRRQIRELKRVGGGIQDNLLVDLFSMSGGVRDLLEGELGAGAYIPAFEIDGLISDPHMPGLFYAFGGRHGMPGWWRTTDDGATWQNISTGLPMTIWYGYIHPMTGDVLAASSLGGYCLPPPAGYPNVPNRGALSAQLASFYGRAAVVDPPV